MKFGLFYLLECPDHDYKRAYDEMLEQIVYAESLGFDTVWLGEHHGSDYGSMPSPAVVAAAVAERTSKIRIGCAVTNVTFRHPTSTAEDWAVVDNISNGRVRFGAGRGYQPREFRAFGIEDKMEDSREMFFEALECIIGLWSNERFTHHGKHYTIDDHELRPTTIQKPHPPVYVAAVSPQTFGLVTEKGFNMLMNPSLSTMDELIQFTIESKRTLLEHGRDPLSLNFPLSWFFHTAETEEEAYEQALPYFNWYFAEAMKHVPQGAKVPKGYEVFAELAEAAKSAGGVSLDDLRAGGILFLGTPDQAIEAIERLYDEMGMHELTTWQRVGGMSHELVMSSIKLTGERIIPHFRDHPPVLPRVLREEAVPAA